MEIRPQKERKKKQQTHSASPKREGHNALPPPFRRAASFSEGGTRESGEPRVDVVVCGPLAILSPPPSPPSGEILAKDSQTEEGEEEEEELCTRIVRVWGEAKGS